MLISNQKFLPSLPLTGPHSLQSTIQSIESVGFEMITLAGSPSEGGPVGFNMGSFKRLALGEVPAPLHFDEVDVPPLGTDADIDPSGAHAAHRLISSLPAWVLGSLRQVTIWRE